MENAKKPAKPTTQITLQLHADALEQIETLANVLHISRPSVIRQAIARWYDSEPLVRNKRKSNGHGDT